MDKKKMRDFLSRTGLGLFLVWGCAAAVFLVIVSAAPFLGGVRNIVGPASLAILAVMTLWYVVDLIASLVRRRWKKAAIMFVMGGVGAAMLVVGLGLAVGFNVWVSAETWKQED